MGAGCRPAQRRQPGAAGIRHLRPAGKARRRLCLGGLQAPKAPEAEGGGGWVWAVEKNLCVTWSTPRAGALFQRQQRPTLLLLMLHGWALA